MRTGSRRGNVGGKESGGEGSHTNAPASDTILFPFTHSDLVQNQTQKQEPLKSHLGMSLWPAT